MKEDVLSDEELAEFEQNLAVMNQVRPSRAKRRADERATNKTKAERSRSGGEKKSEQINFRATPAFKALLAKASEQLKKAETQIIEEAVALYLKKVL